MSSKKTPKRPKNSTAGKQPNAKRQRFVQEYLKDFNATQAAIRAGYSKKTATSQGQRLLTFAEVHDSVQKALEKRANQDKATVDDVLRELVGIAMADTNELVEHRQVACRYCFGQGHRFQRTQAEFDRDVDEYERKVMEAQGSGKVLKPFDEAGGVGYNPTIDPHPGCPECFGEGVSRTIFKDTRKASRGAKALYAGMKMTKDGMEVKLHSKDKSLELLGRHLSMWNDKIKHQGDAENPIVALLKQVQGTSMPVVGDDPDHEGE